MSSFKNAAKSHQKTHRERGQLQERKSLGHLEKRKDYVLRARDYQRKQSTLRLLHKKKLEKNPDEFYFHMINSKLEDGSHHEQSKPTSKTQLKKMQSQDIRYINYKWKVELNKIDKLKSSLHLLNVDKPSNVHTFFVEDRNAVRNFDVAEQLDTSTEFLDRNFNRPRRSRLSTFQLSKQYDPSTIKEVASKQNQSYKELSKRLERQKKLAVLSNKMELKQHLSNSRGTQPRRIKPETREEAPTYRWVQERKR